MVDFTIYEKGWIEEWLKGQLTSLVSIVLSSISVPSINNEQLAQAIDLPESFVRTVKDAYSSGVTDPEEVVEQIDIESEELASWREASVRRGVKVYIQSVCENRFGELPGWVLDKLGNAQDEELQKWMYGSQKYHYLEEIFLAFELGQQVLQVPPGHWEERSFNKGMRRTLRIQLHEKFAEVPFWLDEQMAEAAYEELSELAIRVLDAKTLYDLFPGAAVPPQN
jgi:hypothetical protein